MNKLIAFFLPSLRGGGAEKSILFTVNELARLGYNVNLVLVQHSGEYLKDVNSNVKVVSLNNRRVLFSVFKLAKYIYINKPSILFSSLTHCNIVAILSKILIFSSCRVIVSERNSIYERYNRSFRDKIILLVASFFYRFADSVHAVSFGVKRGLSDVMYIDPQKIHVVYNPVLNKNLYESMSASCDLLDVFHKDKIKIIAVGRLVYQKDFASLLRAFALLPNFNRYSLLIVGTGPLLDDLKNLAIDLCIADHVHFLGFLHNPISLMKKCDLFVLSSLWEGMPNVLVQAMACGIPVVSTDCDSGPSEVLNNGFEGSLVPVASPLDLSNAIIESLSSPKNLDYSNNLKLFDANYSIDQFIEIFIKY